MSSSVHLRRDGIWEACGDPEECVLYYHLQNMSVAEAEGIPRRSLEPLFEAADPPTRITSWGDREWLYDNMKHRDYDLPAVIASDGRREWWHYGWRHRGNDHPAMVGKYGLSWYRRNKQHRDGDRPAVLDSRGELTWYQYGDKHRDDGKPANVWLPAIAACLAHGFETFTTEVRRSSSDWFTPAEETFFGIEFWVATWHEYDEWVPHDETVHLPTLLAETKAALGELPAELSERPEYAILFDRKYA